MFMALTMHAQLFSKANKNDVNYFTPKKIAFAETAVILGGYAGLSTLWYKNYKTVPFHFFNDAEEWLGQDKLGHAYASFHLFKGQHSLLKKSGLPENKAYVWSAISVSGFMLGIEILDGFSDRWGASMYDVAANTSGVLLGLLSEEWRNQIGFKYSFHTTEYSDKRPELLGNGVEELLKDYNAQTYWISWQPEGKRNTPTGNASFLSKLPVVPTIGKSAVGMLGGHNNPEFNSKGECLPQFQREHVWLLSLDINTNAFKPKRTFGKVLLYLASAIKIPAPTLILQNGKLNASWLYY